MSYLCKKKKTKECFCLFNFAFLKIFNCCFRSFNVFFLIILFQHFYYQWNTNMSQRVKVKGRNFMQSLCKARDERDRVSLLPFKKTKWMKRTDQVASGSWIWTLRVNLSELTSIWILEICYFFFLMIFQLMQIFHFEIC